MADLPQSGKVELGKLFSAYSVQEYLDTSFSLPAHSPNHNSEYLMAEYVLIDKENNKKRCILRQRLLNELPPSGVVSYGERIESDRLVGFEHIIIPSDCVNLGAIQLGVSAAAGQLLPSRLEAVEDFLNLNPSIKSEILRVYDNYLDAFAVSLSTGELYLLI
jgi:hypothetical protein